MSLWDENRVERYIRLYGDPRKKEGSQSLLCEDVSRMILGSSVADFGCGVGHLIPYLDPSIRYLGIDSSEMMLEKAKEFFPEREFSLADVTDPESLKQRWGMGFDATVAVSLFLHLTRLDALDALEVLWRHTNPGGMMIFSMETNGTSESRRPDGLLIRNQDPEEVVKDVVAAARSSGLIPDVRHLTQKITTSTLSEFYPSRDKVKIAGINQVARTSIFWAIKKAS